MIDGAHLSEAEGSRLVVGVDWHPDHGRVPKPASTRVHASVCGACGFVELYANKPGELMDAYRRAIPREAV